MQAKLFRLSVRGRSVSAVLFMSLSAFAANYYLTPAGDDSKAGTSSATAWASLSKISGMALKAGDSVLLEGGKIFSGTLAFDANDNGTTANPVVIATYGSGKATINTTSESCITINGTQGIIVRNLIVIGSGVYTGNYNPLKNGVTLSGTTNAILADLEASKFGDNGIGGTGTGYQILNCYCHDNGYSGITSKGTNYLVRGCVCRYNPGCPNSVNQAGNGIFAAGTGGVIEYCETAYNGGNQNPGVENGPVGCWFWSCTNMTIQNCIAHNNKSNAGDGGGFDMDGNAKNSRIQYCYSYNNQGPGYLICQPGCQNNTIRYCISQNDWMHRWENGSPEIWGGSILFGTYAGNLSNIYLYGNTIYAQDVVSPFNVNGVGSGVSNICIFNNIFVMRGIASFVSDAMDNSVYDTAYYKFRGNCWYSLDGKSGGWAMDRVGTYKTLDAWRTATGQEKLNGVNVGISADPLLTAPGAGDTLIDPTRLPQLTAYKLKAGSPCIDAGVDLKAVGITDPGTRDFYGSAILVGGKYDIGAHEYGGMPVAVAHPEGNRHAAIRAMTTGNAHGIDVYDLSGRAVKASATAHPPASASVRLMQAGKSQTNVTVNVKR